MGGPASEPIAQCAIGVPYVVSVRGPAAQSVFSAACQGDSPIFAAEAVERSGIFPGVPRESRQSPVNGYHTCNGGWLPNPSRTTTSSTTSGRIGAPERRNIASGAFPVVERTPGRQAGNDDRWPPRIWHTTCFETNGRDEGATCPAFTKGKGEQSCKRTRRRKLEWSTSLQGPECGSTASGRGIFEFTIPRCFPG